MPNFAIEKNDKANHRNFKTNKNTDQIAKQACQNGEFTIHGTIVARGLFGEAIEKKLAEILHLRKHLQHKDKRIWQKRTIFVASKMNQ